MAWLNAPVETENKDAEKQSRSEEIRTAFSFNVVGDSENCIFTKEYADSVLEMPEIDSEFSYLIEWIHELGFYVSNGMGASVIPYHEIYAWSELMKLQPSPSDIAILREMSGSFISMQELAKKRDTIDPLKTLLENEHDY